MKTYTDFVNAIVALQDKAAQVKAGRKGFPEKGKIAASARKKALSKFEKLCAKEYLKFNRKVLIFAPHPDDESMTGALAVRMMNECGLEVADVAVTLGSNVARKAERREELKAACKLLGWELILTGKDALGFNRISKDTRETDKPYWDKCVSELAKIIKKQKPVAVFLPNKNDWNKTHIGVAYLVSDAIEKAKYGGVVFETEYWGAMAKANLLAEIDARTLSAQIAAVACHTKEVARNDYHLRLPAWMADNVRRGGEIVGGQGGDAPKFKFGVIYNVLNKPDSAPNFLTAQDNPVVLFQ